METFFNHGYGMVSYVTRFLQFFSSIIILGITGWACGRNRHRVPGEAKEMARLSNVYHRCNPFLSVRHPTFFRLESNANKRSLDGSRPSYFWLLISIGTVAARTDGMESLFVVANTQRKLSVSLHCKKASRWMSILYTDANTRN
ncbi:hypothetical protein N7478_008134 [Penicillium angulare]|uniref:uncharacterized protein n=1 Tax=Penicillium angulare TaxID=116970 RepID=UPI0025410490|nr:uncharacterized protein N7478_008134 [Penicillium angulare]KAJ5273009.1 hypothetical protein N7478_008134 [Penicillium angulare]